MNMSFTEKEEQFLNELKKTEGKDFKKWISLIEKSGQDKFKDIISYLQEKHKLEYRTAHSLTHIYLRYIEQVAPRLSYTQDGRGGKVIYTQDKIRFEMDWEFGGGNAIAIIFIPEEKFWEKETGTKLKERDSILDFIGKQVIKDQAGGDGKYRIDWNSLVILK